MIFKLSNFLNPNTLGIQYGIDFYILNQELGFLYEKRNCSIQIYIPSRPKFISISPSNISVGQLSNITFTILPVSFLYPNSSISIKFPNEFVFASIILSYV